MAELDINRGKFILVDETSGRVCFVGVSRMIASRSTCYRVKRELSRKFPKHEYRVYELVRLGR